ncbi:hypothetical protein DSLASN_22070 [Desulfoluna limicola]|uniref:Uncharacterized protein n=1 Tax=Desulfoluna limicola TaxID=2810562 RepID=A0ABM7PGV9_9BACT|nr:hypothetical protein [Desulfoluna limicola]BCS96575.1 hypothetical protein DSLASN_22070 [Desulfoluna limicola]
MKNMTLKMTQCLMIAGILMITAPPSIAGLTSLNDQELKGITAQSGIQTLMDDSLTEEQRREQEKNNSPVQALMALNQVLPSELLRDIQNAQRTFNDSTRIVREVNTMHKEVLAVPTAISTITTIISLPAMGVGGFF